MQLDEESKKTYLCLALLCSIVSDETVHVLSAYSIRPDGTCTDFVFTSQLHE